MQINGQLSDWIDNSWHTLGVSLSCLNELGADLKRIFQPVVLSSSGDWEVELSNIRLAAAAEVETIDCIEK